ncbi:MULTISPECIES: hypothetical protein [unclassified Methylobacterium]|jgi:hypothetical protein|uniref:hypothetical protein n=1 Tax=unclassified Methylobacterium TaxID=2615210 RepID=UPI0013529AEB|nr:hypothetical protein [Methylobacterium sp. 2A]MWV22515.1 hypothetical protein [Methylobacterium sp. 2A]
MIDLARRGSGLGSGAGRTGLADRAAAWAVLMFSAGTILSATVQRHLFEQTQTTQHLIEFNVGEAFALAALLSQLLTVPDARMTLARSDRAVLVLSALAWFIPEQHGVYLATTLAGSWLSLRGRADRHWAGIAQIWLALSIYELWGKLVFKMAYQSIEGAEIGLISRIGRLVYGGIGTEGASLSVRGDWAIVILEGCSSFHNLSLAVLVWLSILKIAAHPVDRAALAALATSFGLVVAINVARILAMLPSREAYHFWHDDAGSSLVALAAVVAMIVPALLWTKERTCAPHRRP